MLSGLTDYHLHTPLCRHAQGWPVDFARKAVQLGLSEIGFADHNPFPEKLDDWRMDWNELPHYFDAVDQARAAFPHFQIRLALECDFLPGRESVIETLRNFDVFDYLIGSVHYIMPDWDVDNPKWVGRIDDFGLEETWRLYQQRYVEAIRSGLFEFVGHPDLPKKFGHRPVGDLQWFIDPIVEALVETGVAYEINTAGFDKPCAEVYPEFSFIQKAQDAGVPVVINSDAHKPEEVGRHFAMARELAFQAGYTETVRWTQGRRTLVPFTE